MNNQRLGCLSPLAILSALITLVVLIVLEVTGGNSMFTAGALNAQAGQSLNGYTSHAEIGKDCGLCHVAFWSRQSMSERCVECHAKIGQELLDSAKLHGAILEKNPAAECRDCHPEHRGPDASLTLMDDGNFPHEVVGFALTAHQFRSNRIPFTCNDCHGEDITSFNQQTCTACHKQLDTVFTTAHALEFGSDCLVCHDGVDRYGNFDHSQVTFKLTGKHSGVVCSQCHLNARTVPDLQNTATACEACHQKNDPHSGRFGAACGVCHTSEGWKPAKFDHNLADFKLEGEHTEVKCEECHSNGQYQDTPQACYACHQEDDEHNGAYGTQCETCHTPSSWEEFTFDHNLSVFPLTGAHVDAKCEQCHANQVFKGTSADCYACHQNDDEHQGRFGTLCNACHSTEAWKPATFDHSRSNFPLTGAHTRVLCESCHKNGQFQGTPTFCAGCHGNPAFHAGLFTGQACSDCHNVNTWVPARFNGSHPGIADEGGSGVNHGGKGCRSCHTVNLSTATCTACHDNNNPGEGGGDD